jgi:hypothetical protein
VGGRQVAGGVRVVTLEVRGGEAALEIEQGREDHAEVRKETRGRTLGWSFFPWYNALYNFLSPSSHFWGIA